MTGQIMLYAAECASLVALAVTAGFLYQRSLRRQLDARTGELRAREEESRKLSLVANRAHNSMLMTGADGVIEWINESVTRETGFTAHRLHGRSLDTALGELEVEPSARDAVRLGLRNQSDFTVPLSIRDASGSRRSVSISAQPVHDDEGRLTNWIVIGNDVTELEHAQEAMRRRVQQTLRYKTALLGLAQSDMSDLTDAVRRITEAAAHALEIERVSVWFLTEEPSAIRCQDLFCLTGGVHQDGAVLYASDHPAYFTALREHQTIDAADAQHDPRTAGFAEDYLRPLGIASMLDVPIWLGGKSIGVLCHGHVGSPRAWSEDECAFASSAADMVSLALQTAERAGAERALRAERDQSQQIIMGSPAIICGITPEGRTTFINPAGEDVTGYKADELVGQNAWPIFYPAMDDPQVAAMIQDLSSRTVRELEMVLTTKSGEPRAIAWNSINRRDADGRLVEIIGFGHDVTVRRQTEEQHRLARESAEVASRLKSDFLATMSHEIRTPLNGVIGMTGVLLDTPLSEEQREYADAIRCSGEALLGVINDVLDFSKIEAGKLALELIDFNVRGVVEEAIGLLQEPACRKGLELIAIVPAEVPAALRGDPGRLRQVLTNLIGNAVKFTERGEVVVRLGVVDHADGTLVIRFDVSDTGIGLTSEQQSRIFDAFTQADGSTTRRHGGTGLGLSISRRLVELMHGEIGVTSERAAGSTFWFTVPLTMVEAGEAVQPGSTTLEGARVLIVDDHEAARSGLSEAVSRLGMVPGTAEGGRRALALLRDAHAAGNPFCVAVVSQQLADIGGVELAREIDADPALHATKVIVVMALGRVRSTVSAQRGVHGLVTKPIRQAQLLQCLRTVLAVPDDARPEPGARTTPGRPGITAHWVPASPRVLVAEDNVINQKVAARMLEKLGVRVDVVANGLEAVDAVAAIPYALVLMDCQMPEMDGMEATREIRRLEHGSARLPIVAMTANTQKDDRDRCLAAGMDDHIPKPISKEVLEAALHRWLVHTPSLPAPQKSDEMLARPERRSGQ